MKKYEHVYLDVSIIRCPYCKKLYADSSWYIIDMESDITCNICGKEFNTRRNIVSRILIKFDVLDGSIRDVNIEKELEI